MHPLKILFWKLLHDLENETKQNTQKNNHWNFFYYNPKCRLNMSDSVWHK